MEKVKKNIEDFLKELNIFCRSLGRDPGTIAILAATKYADCAAIQSAIDGGIHIIGENRIQDAARKFSLLKGDFRKHFIGHLQTNKVRQAVRLFDCIESIDSLALSELLDSEAEKQSKILDVLVQVKTSSSLSQHGIGIMELDPFIADILMFSSLRLKGIMTILPENFEEAKKAAERLQSVFSDLRVRYPDLEVLSMGMSHDYRLALEYGATELRIGSLFFGE